MAAPSLSGDIDMDAQSMIQVEVPPWSESYELSAADTEGTHYMSSRSYSMTFL